MLFTKKRNNLQKVLYGELYVSSRVLLDVPRDNGGPCAVNFVCAQEVTAPSSPYH